jgi:hypothetical protein
VAPGALGGFRLVTTVQLANAPEEEFEEWLADVQAELRRLSPSTSLDRSGAITFHSQAEIDPEALIGTVEQALSAAERLAQERAAERPKQETELAAIAEPYRELLAELSYMGTTMFSKVTATPAPVGPGRIRDETFRIAAVLADELQGKARGFNPAFYMASRPEQYINLLSSPFTVYFSGVYTPDRCAEIAAVACQIVEGADRAEAEQQAKEQAARAALETRLQNLIESRQRTPTGR